MANLLQSSQCKATVAPSYYNNYLQCLANSGKAAVCNAQYIGATCLQKQAFTCAAKNAGNMAGNFTTGAGMVGCAANKNIAGATTGYLNTATNASPLCAANPYITKAANMNLGQVAQCYMSPYLNSAVQNMSDIAQRNIQMNLAPQATAGAVGSGQFGSQRGAQVLGQTMANAEQCLEAQMATMENQGWATAMCGAKSKEAALNQAGQTAETAQNAQNQIELQAAQEAANAATQCAAAKNAAGLAMGTLGTEGLNAKIACQNALATLGAQCQTIQQNAQCYGMNKLGKYSALMQGHAVPTTVKTTMCASPLSALAAAAAAAKGSGLLCKVGGWICKAFSCNKAPCGQCYASFCTCGYGLCGKPVAKGGSIHAKAYGGRIGCSSTSHLGGLPVRRK